MSNKVGQLIAMIDTLGDTSWYTEAEWFKICGDRLLAAYFAHVEPKALRAILVANSAAETRSGGITKTVSLLEFVDGEPEIAAGWHYRQGEAVRITTMDVTFYPDPTVDIIAAKLDRLEKERLACVERLQALSEMKQQLLAIEYKQD